MPFAATELNPPQHAVTPFRRIGVANPPSEQRPRFAELPPRLLLERPIFLQNQVVGLIFKNLHEKKMKKKKKRKKKGKEKRKRKGKGVMIQEVVEAIEVNRLREAGGRVLPRGVETHGPLVLP